jgi:RNA polymerase sigma factor (sigma-70 family)
MKLEDLSDEDLMAEMQKGNENAFTALYTRYQPALLNYLMARIDRDQDAAEDVLQAVFMRIHKHMAKFTPGLLFRPWLYSMADRLAKNANRDLHRRITRERPDTDFEPIFDGARAESATLRVTDRNTLAACKATGVETEAMLEMLPQLVLELPQELRQVVEFVASNGASLRTAETILGIGRRTLSRRLKEACDIIRDRLDGIVKINSTSSDVSLSAINSLIDTLPALESQSLARVIIHEEHSSLDMAVFVNVLGKAMGNVSIPAIPV